MTNAPGSPSPSPEGHGGADPRPSDGRDDAGRPAGARRQGGGLHLSGWDIGFLVSVLVLLVGSVMPLAARGLNVWNTSGLFYLGVGVLAPLAAVGFVLARANGAGGAPGPRVGSLNTAQFAAVASWLAFAFFFISVVTTLNPVLLIGLIGSLGMLATVPLRDLVAGALASSGGAREPRPARGDAATGHEAAAAPAEMAAASEPAPAPDREAAADREAAPDREAGGDVQDFGAPAGGELAEPRDGQGQRDQSPGADLGDGRGTTRPHPRSTEEASATAAFGAPGTDHAEGEEVTAASAASPATADSTGPDTGTAAEAGGATAPSSATDADATTPVADTEPEPAAPRGSEPAGYEAFWFAVGTYRTTVDPDDGSPAFGLEPGGWILALEDRGHEFLVQNTDGRTGVLRDLTDIERA